ncbi:uncharacterized protein LOC110849379 [Folsomia candida]|uniref:Uncharacterized protein n=1 Tax=Folsomia candida TaxID=158441 RepID=A0A226EJD0_FOLCA|nr:uncharacterized protein LOC110849379 [Folsomia candida]OXA56656.1 hypothetical protein Fcan01_09556 [Folsomia candida]
MAFLAHNFLALTILIIVPAIRSDSNLVTVTESKPTNGTEDSISLEDRVENLSFNLRFMEEVLMKWKTNFKLIDERFSNLEKQVADLISEKKSTTTTTTTNSPRQIAEP